MRFLLIAGILFLFLSTANGQEDRLSPFIPESDTTQFIYEVSLRYEGSSVSVDPNYQYTLSYLADLLRKNPKWTLHIRGHVCCGPSEKISEKRARGVYNYLLGLGVPAERMTYKGYSDRMPLAFPEKKEEDENINRRVDFVIHR